MTDWKALGAKLGRALASLVPEAAAARIRASYAEKFGTCRRCAAPLGGPSPEQICEPCHTDELLELAAGSKDVGDA